MTNDGIGVDAVREALREWKDPESGRSALEQGQIHDIRVDGRRVALNLDLTTWAAPLWREAVANVEDTIRTRLPGVEAVDVTRGICQRPPRPLGAIGLTAKSVIAVGSGKGGVGKSTIAASLAVGLQRSGAQAGLVDADVYGPSIPHLLGVSQRPEVVQNRIRPIMAHGMPVMSMGFLVPPGEAVVWRGPMLHGAITQFLRDTDWGPLDYLIIDMPPGTGDIALTLSQLLPLTGAVVVCTPQEIALLDAVKAIAMFRKVNIEVLGMVENMSGFVCPDCGRRYDIFGSGGARQRAEQLGVPFLGEVPLQMQIRELGDAGQVEASFQNPTAGAYLERLVYQLIKQLAHLAATSPGAAPLPEL
jgi:ATP-binding protein involved in chromosome partitioning